MTEIRLLPSQALARRLQREEDARVQAMHTEYQRRAEEQRRRDDAVARETDTSQNYGTLGNLEGTMANLEIQPKKKKECIAM